MCVCPIIISGVRIEGIFYCMYALVGSGIRPYRGAEQIKRHKPVLDSPAVFSRRENRNTCVAVRNVHPFVSADFKLRPFGFRLSACAAFYITHLYIAGNFVRIHRRAEIRTEHFMRFPPVNLGCKFHDRTADGENDLLYNP